MMSPILLSGITIWTALLYCAECGDFTHLTLSSSRPTYSGAKTLCKAGGYGDLAIIDSQAEYDRMRVYFDVKYGSGYTPPRDFWIGMSQVNDGSGWSWSWDVGCKREPMTWVVWGPGEPDGIGSQICTRINRNFDFKTIYCASTYDVLCETADVCEELFESSTFLVSFTHRSENGTATYLCKPGYAHTGGDLVRSCERHPNLMWSGDAPTCELACENSQVQTCHQCNPAPNVCESFDVAMITEEQCHNLLANDNTSLVTYDSALGTCSGLDCRSNIDFFAKPLWMARTTCNLVCVRFTLSSISRNEISSTPDTMFETCGISECLIACFDKPNCYLLTYDSFTYECRIFTSCDINSCSQRSSTTAAIYYRTCITVCDEIANAYSYDVVVDSDRSPGATANYTCAPGFENITASQRVCLDTLFWNGSEPACASSQCYPNVYIQECHNCGSDDSTCVLETTLNAPLPECMASVEGDGVVSAYYDPTTLNCLKYSCHDNMFFENTKVLFRSSCNDDCKKFTMSTVPSQRVSDSIPENRTFYTSSIGECFAACFDLYQCYTFFYNSELGLCKLYTDCGTTCSTVNDANSVVYVRTCNIDCGPLSPPPNGVVSLSGGVTGNTTFGAIATYSCNYGYVQSHYLTRTCASNSAWSNTMPLCNLIGPTTKRPDAPLYIMPCICYNNYSWTGLSQDEITQLLVRETTLQKNTTSRYLNRLSCREDPRSSSTVVGVVGSAVIGGFFLMIFLADVPTLYNHIREAIRNVKGHS